MVQVPVGKNHELNLAAFEHGGDIVLLIDVVHPLVIPSGIHHKLSLFSLQRGHRYQDGISPGIVPLPGYGILVGHASAIIHDIFLEQIVIKPACLC